MSTLDVVAEILREVAPRALKARQIATLANGRLPSASKTPETVISRDLAIDVRDRKETSRFLRVDRGAFVLKEALPTALYNDVDGYAAAWTRNLVAAGEIAAGVVDERSIRDLDPADVASYRQFHAFSGIGVWSRALRDAGWPDDVNVWSGSCPCTPFSAAGRKQGFSDEQHLWPEWFRLIAACRPALLFGEQVSSKDGLVWVDAVFADLERADYTCRAFDLPAAGVGAPHRRQRLYFVAYARERGLEILGAPWLHARGQAGHDADRCGAVDVGCACAVLDPHGERREGRETSISSAGNGRPSFRGAVDEPGAVSDAAGARPQMSQDPGADLGDAGEDTEEVERRTPGDLELERGRDDDDTGTVSDHAGHRRNEGSTLSARITRGDHAGEDGTRSAVDRVDDDSRVLSDAECLLRDEGRRALSHGRAEVEPYRYGEADGAGCACLGAVELGDAGLARGRRDAGALPGAEGAGEGEWIEARDLADEPVVAGADDGAVETRSDDSADSDDDNADSDDDTDSGDDDVALVRGPTVAAGRGSGFHPGDRIRRAGDPTWGGAVRGYWADDVEWIYCRPEPGHQDGRWRPVVAGTEPLVAGPSVELGRTRAARLRGYGNSIVLPLAKVFVESVIDSFAEAAREAGIWTHPIVAPTRVEAVVPTQVEDAREQLAAFAWTGPNADEVAPSGMLLGRVPGERWPYGPPSFHEACCRLFPHRGSPGGLFCDCAASAADDLEYGVSP